MRGASPPPQSPRKAKANPKGKGKMIKVKSKSNMTPWRTSCEGNA